MADNSCRCRARFLHTHLQDIGMKGRLQGFLDGMVFRLADGMRHMHILILLAGNTTSSDIKWRQIV